MSAFTTLLALYAHTFKIGLFSVGGGFATIPFFQALQAGTEWFSEHTLANMIALAQCLPGAFGNNLAAFCGYTTGDLLEAGLAGNVAGAAVGLAGLLTPCVAIICVVSRLMERFKNSQLYQDLLSGLRPAALALIIGASLSVCRLALLNSDELAAMLAGEHFVFTNLIELGPCVLLVAVLVASNVGRFKKLHPMVWIFACAIVGICLGF